MPDTIRLPAVGLCLILVALALIPSGCGRRSSQDAPVKVRVLSSADKREWIAAAVERFNKSKPRLSGSRPVVAEVIFTPNEEMTPRAADPETAAHAAIPAASWLLSEANDESLARGDGRLFTLPGTSIARTPLVFVVYREVAERMGWLDSGLGWRELATLSAEPDFFKDASDGSGFTLSYPDPESTHTGAMTLLALGSVARGGAPLRQARDLDPPAVAAMFTSFELSLPCYFPSPESLVATMAETSPRQLSVGVAFEHQVVSRKASKSGQSLVAIPPREGTWIADHPFALIDRPWVGPAERDAARLLLNYLLGEREQAEAESLGMRPAQRSPRREPPFLPPEGLDPAEPSPLDITPSKELVQRARESWRTVRRPATVLFLIDVSPSMAAREPSRLEMSKTLVGNILPFLSPSDRVGLAVAGRPLRWLIPVRRTGEDALASFDAALAELRTEDGTALHDSIQAVIRQLGASKPIRAPVALLVFSDGTDEESRIGIQVLNGELGNFIRDGSLFRLHAFSLDGVHGFDAMRRFALATGGRVFEPTPGTEREVAREVAGSF